MSRFNLPALLARDSDFCRSCKRLFSICICRKVICSKCLEAGFNAANSIADNSAIAIAYLSGKITRETAIEFFNNEDDFTEFIWLRKRKAEELIDLKFTTQPSS